MTSAVSIAVQHLIYFPLGKTSGTLVLYTTNKNIGESLQSRSLNFSMPWDKLKYNQLLFLDILITNIKIKILTNIYRKTTFTGQYLHYQSFCSTKRKVNLIKTQYHRAYQISSKELHNLEVERIKTIKKNRNPLDLMKKIIKSHQGRV